MQIDLISIGDELLIGQTLNTNAHWLSKQLNTIGFQIRQHVTISDDKEIIVAALDHSLRYSDVVIITGGLGPTKDDLTLEVLTKYFGGKLVQNQEVYQDIERLITGRGYRMNELNKQQALVPDVAQVIRNKNGTAPGTWFEKEGKIVVSLPGVPYEMKAMMEHEVIPSLKKRFELPHIIHQMVYTQGVPESQLAEMLEDWENNLPQSIKLAYLPSPGRVKLRLSMEGKDKKKLEQTLENQLIDLQSIIGKFIFSFSESELEVVIGNLLREKQQTLATAESCTGGYIAHLITKVSGASDYFKGAIIAYANETKINQLNVNANDIEQFGAVSQQVVEQMATGVREQLKTDYGIATSGVAGPLGGTPEKPVGTVWIAVASVKGVKSKLFQLGKERDINIERSAVAALGMLRGEIA